MRWVDGSVCFTRNSLPSQRCFSGGCGFQRSKLPREGPKAQDLRALSTHWPQRHAAPHAMRVLLQAPLSFLSSVFIYGGPWFRAGCYFKLTLICWRSQVTRDGGPRAAKPKGLAGPCVYNTERRRTQCPGHEQAVELTRRLLLLAPGQWFWGELGFISSTFPEAAPAASLSLARSLGEILAKSCFHVCHPGSFQVWDCLLSWPWELQHCGLWKESNLQPVSLMRQCTPDPTGGVSTGNHLTQAFSKHCSAG